MAKHYGEVKHSRKKSAKWRESHMPRARTVALSSRVFREQDGSYTAITCPIGEHGRAKALLLRSHVKRCAEGNGRSPTKALKKSLSALAKKL